MTSHRFSQRGHARASFHLQGIVSLRPAWITVVLGLAIAAVVTLLVSWVTLRHADGTEPATDL